mmetsp:Transcript_116313/g.173781  ORF Transcript_116313/g.173781 Transcript_116313/m.173781 type:complete len:97 (+) Transcript_116313:94-384(+)
MLAVMTDGAVRTTEITFSIILPVRGFVVDPVCSENLYIKGRSLGSSTHLLALSLNDVCKANPRLGVMEKDPPSGGRFTTSLILAVLCASGRQEPES